MRDVTACREAYPDRYVKVVAYDSSLGRQTSMLSFIVNRPDEEPGFRLERQDKADRQMRYTLHPYAQEKPVGRRYGNEGDLATSPDPSRASRDGASSPRGLDTTGRPLDPRAGGRRGRRIAFLLGRVWRHGQFGRPRVPRPARPVKNLMTSPPRSPTAKPTCRSSFASRASTRCSSASTVT